MKEFRSLKIERVPGNQRIDGQDVLYLRAADIKEMDVIFGDLTSTINEPYPSSGAISCERVELRARKIGSYFAILFLGDLRRWADIIEQFAQVRNIPVGRIVGSEFVDNLGNRVDLSVCEFIQHLAPIGYKKQKASQDRLTK